MSSTRTRVIGTCRLIEPIGKGGMAEIFRGLQTTLQREVAVKVILPDISEDREALTRFRREALALAGLAHENIVTVHDLVEKNDQLFMLMELVDGVDVRSLLTECGPLPLDVALIIAWKVAAALEHAHFRRILHRDVKPANVMISKKGEVKLTDFGIAKDLDIDDLTRTGLMVGTPSYMPPEVLKGQRPDPRSDLYAAGVMLFEMLTGKKPFSADNQGQLFAQIASGKHLKLRKIRADVPRSVARIVDRCLMVDPSRRWSRSAELRMALEQEASRQVLTTPAARLVHFLKAHGRVREDDVSWLDLEDRWFTGADLGESPRVEESLHLSVSLDMGDTDADESADGQATRETKPPPLAESAAAAQATGEHPPQSLETARWRLGAVLRWTAVGLIAATLLLVVATALGLALAPGETESLLGRLFSEEGIREN